MDFVFTHSVEGSRHVVRCQPGDIVGGGMTHEEAREEAFGLLYGLFMGHGAEAWYAQAKGVADPAGAAWSGAQIAGVECRVAYVESAG